MPTARLISGRLHTGWELTPGRHEHQASAGAQFGPTALLHPWKAAVTLPLSRSMPGSCEVPDGLTHRAAIASAWKEQRGTGPGPLEPPLSSSS